MEAMDMWHLCRDELKYTCFLILNRPTFQQVRKEIVKLASYEYTSCFCRVIIKQREGYIYKDISDDTLAVETSGITIHTVSNVHIVILTVKPLKE